MINLLAAEFTRLRSRRIVIIWLIGLLVAVAGFQVLAGFVVRQPTAAEIATARHQLQQAQADYTAHHDADVKQCKEDNPGQADACDYPPPTLNDYLRTPETFAATADAGLTVSTVFTALIFLVIGASMIGAEYSSGAIANWLSFIPDRTRVYASKITVVALAAAVVGAVAAALTLATTAVLVKINSGAVDHVGDLAATGARGLIVVVVATAVGFALALVSRHTIAALGVVVGYLVADFVLNIVMASLDPVQKIKPWLPDKNAQAVIEHGISYQDQVTRVTADGTDYAMVTRHLSFGHGLVYLLAVLAVAVGVSLLVFRRRDIT